MKEKRTCLKVSVKRFQKKGGQSPPNHFNKSWNRYAELHQQIHYLREQKKHKGFQAIYAKFKNALKQYQVSEHLIAQRKSAELTSSLLKLRKSINKLTPEKLKIYEKILRCEENKFF